MLYFLGSMLLFITFLESSVFCAKYESTTIESSIFAKRHQKCKL